MSDTQFDDQYTWYGNTFPVSGNVSFSSGSTYNFASSQAIFSANSLIDTSMFDFSNLSITAIGNSLNLGPISPSYAYSGTGLLNGANLPKVVKV